MLRGVGMAGLKGSGVLSPLPQAAWPCSWGLLDSLSLCTGVVFSSWGPPHPALSSVERGSRGLGEACGVEAAAPVSVFPHPARSPWQSCGKCRSRRRSRYCQGRHPRWPRLSETPDSQAGTPDPQAEPSLLPFPDSRSHSHSHPATLSTSPHVSLPEHHD